MVKQSYPIALSKLVHPSGNQAQDDPAPKQRCRDERRMNRGGKEIDDEHDGSQKVYYAGTYSETVRTRAHEHPSWD